jgi:hypothetical protein
LPLCRSNYRSSLKGLRIQAGTLSLIGHHRRLPAITQALRRNQIFSYGRRSGDFPGNARRMVRTASGHERPIRPLGVMSPLPHPADILDEMRMTASGQVRTCALSESRTSWFPHSPDRNSLRQSSAGDRRCGDVSSSRGSWWDAGIRPRTTSGECAAAGAAVAGILARWLEKRRWAHRHRLPTRSRRSRLRRRPQCRNRLPICRWPTRPVARHGSRIGKASGSGHRRGRL